MFESNREIGAVIRKARLEIGMEQVELAQQLGVSPFCLNRLEAGNRSFDDKWLYKLPETIQAAVVEFLRTEFDRYLEGKRKLSRRAPVPENA